MSRAEDDASDYLPWDSSWYWDTAYYYWGVDVFVDLNFMTYLCE